MSFAWRARVAVEVRYGWLCVVGVSGANAPVNAQPHQKIAAMLGRPGHSTAWCVDGGQCPLLALSRHQCSTLSMSAFGGKADIPNSLAMSANDPKRTLKLSRAGLASRQSFRSFGCHRPSLGGPDAGAFGRSEPLCMRSLTDMVCLRLPFMRLTHSMLAS